MVTFLLREDQQFLEKHNSAGLDSILVLKIAFALNGWSKKMTGAGKPKVRIYEPLPYVFIFQYCIYVKMICYGSVFSFIIVYIFIH